MDRGDQGQLDRRLPEGVGEKAVELLDSVRTSEGAFVVIVASIVGLLGGLGAVGFRVMIRYFQEVFFGNGLNSFKLAVDFEHMVNLFQLAINLPWYHKIIAPMAGGLIIGPIIYFLAREAKGHGVPEVMEAVTLREGRIRPRVVFVKSLASAICIGSGGSVGREGPIVQIGSAIGSTLAQFLKISAERMRILVGCGAAAGIAATFNAPLAGAMFGVEIILGDFGITIISPIILSSVIATVVSRHFLGSSPAFIVPQYSLVSAWEILSYAALGCLAGLAALAFIVTLYKTEDIFDELGMPEYLKAATGGLVLGSMAILFPQILGVGYETIGLALRGQMVWYLLLVLVLFKLLAVSITIGSGGSGGIFAPSLFLGSMLGGVFGWAVHSTFPSATAPAGAYALVGMGAVVAGTTHGPITAILILFELTDDYKIILPLIVACVTSTLLTTRLKRESIYTLKLLRRGIDIRRGREVHIMKSLYVQDAMERDVGAIPEDMPLTKLISFVEESPHTAFPVVDGEGRLIGIIAFQELRNVLFKKGLEHLIVARDLAKLNPITTTEREDLYEVLKKMDDHDIGKLPVVDDTNRIIGMITRKDLLAAYNEEVMRRELEKR